MYHKVKLILISGLLISLLTSCQEQNTNPSPKTVNPLSKTNLAPGEKLFETEAELAKARRNMVFQPILDTLTAEDSIFLPSLVKQYALDDWADAEVVNWEKNALYGYTDSIWFLNLKLPNDSLCLPFGKHYQLLFDLKGHLLHEDSAAQASLIKVWKDQAPLLMTLQQDCVNQGQHHFYKYEKGVMIDIFNVLLESTPPTFDQSAAEDDVLYRPHQLRLKLEDRNKDGWNDLVFTGRKLTLKGPDKKKTYNEWYPYKNEKLEYVFIFHKNEDWFVLQQD